MNLIKISKGKESPNVLSIQAEQLKKIQGDDVISFLVGTMFPRLMKVQRGKKEEDDSDDSEPGSMKKK